MSRLPFRHRCRLITNALVGMMPRSVIRIFLRSFEWRRDVCESVGYNVIPRDFQSSIPLNEEVDFARLNQRRLLPGVDYRVENACEMIKKLGSFSEEVDEVPYEHVNGESFWFDNQSFTDFDAFVLYALLRELKPKRYVELGCGFSSFMSSRALATNIGEGSSCDAVYADPCPRRDMARMMACGQLIEKRVQELPMTLFAQLEPGDVLFIDTSHVLKLQGDVEHEILRILPSLRPGVWIHFHDVFSPYDYPEDWLTKPLPHTCNEQYVVEALLSGGNRYQVELPLYLLWKEKLDILRTSFPRGITRPQGFWIRKMK